MLKQFKSVYDQKKPTAMIQRNPKNQDFSLRKLKYFVIQFRKTERRIWWRDVIKMHYGKCSISECQLQCIKTPAPTASARIFLYASQHVFLSFLTHCTFFFTSNFLSHTATDVFWWNKRSASQLWRTAQRDRQVNICIFWWLISDLMRFLACVYDWRRWRKRGFSQDNLLSSYMTLT